MSNNICFEKLTSLVQTHMATLEPGHDFFHIQRVIQNAQIIHQKEGGCITTILLAALLHELPDPKFFKPGESIKLIKSWFRSCQFDETICENVLAIIQNLSFSKELDGAVSPSVEFCIVQDADRLDAIGAIGIARTFSYGASKGRAFFDANVYPEVFISAGHYQNAPSPTINHFFEKLLLLKSKMKTSTGQLLANERHQFMVNYLTHFFSETAFDNAEQKSQWLNLLKQHL
jgi:uncharacterized protein